MEDAQVGSTRKRKFLIALLGGFIIFSSFLATLGFTGTIFALPLGGMGDFYVTFDELEGEDFTLHPQVGETGNRDQAPLVRNEMKTATIKKLHIYKDLKLPTGKWIRINITADQPSKIEGLIQDARFIDADLSFDEMAIEESNTSSMPVEEAFKKNWTQHADKVRITGAKIVTDYLFQNMVTLNGAKISIEGIDQPDMTGDNSKDSEGSNVGGESNADNGGKGDGQLLSNSSSSEVKSSDNSSNDEDGGFLPNTASNWGWPIMIGTALILIGIVLLLRRKNKRSSVIEH